MQFGRTGFGFFNSEVLYKSWDSEIYPSPSTPFSERIEII